MSMSRTDDVLKSHGDKNNDSLAVFHAARNMFLIASKEKRSKYLSDLISDAKGNSRKLFTLVMLCDKKSGCELPACNSAASLANEFGENFENKLNAIRISIGVTEPLLIPVRHGNGVNLSTFTILSGDDVRKLIIQSKSTSCSLDPIPTSLIKQYIVDSYHC